jgi:hypothetical protein
MSSSLFNDTTLSTAQIDSDYRLSKLNEAELQVDAVQGTNANNNILIGSSISNVPAVANMVIIGNGDKTNSKPKDILLGDGGSWWIYSWNFASWCRNVCCCC